MWSKFVVVALSMATLSSLTLPNTSPNKKENGKVDPVIYWSASAKLVGSDFKRKPLAESKFSAASHLGTGLEMSYSEEEVSFTVKAYFVPDKSWIKVYDSDLLTHEQTHFDIEEYYARLVRKELKRIRTKGRSFEAIRKESDEIFARLLAEREACQEQFDAESRHSLHEENELEWEQRIQKGLEETEEFANPTIAFRM